MARPFLYDLLGLFVLMIAATNAANLPPLSHVAELQRADIPSTGQHNGSTVTATAAETDIIDAVPTEPTSLYTGSLTYNSQQYLNLINGFHGYESATGSSQYSTSSSTTTKSPTQTPAPPKPVLNCNGLGKNIYANRDTLIDLVNQFCSDAAQQGGLDKNSASISRHYLDKTLDMTDISIDYPPGKAFVGQDKCSSSMKSIVDGCDTNNNRYKGGGNLVDGDVTYRLNPRANRQPASKGVNGGCGSYYKAVRQETSLWGQGWATSDFGHSILESVKNKCAAWDYTWKFEYGLGDDGREWTASFQGGVFQRGCIGHAIGDISGISGFGCQGSG
ncbi:hypothetical protein K449DRAFT_179580 [Hypoxylon sp. EC38]|nr:hypothetical protein K449DRAFT_179580 [Hypoxylon sp. EC38]